MCNLCINENGEVEIKSRSPKAIQNIREWIDAFIIFMAIYIKKFSDKASELLQHMSSIREAESRNKEGGGGWKVYG